MTSLRLSTAGIYTCIHTYRTYVLENNAGRVHRASVRCVSYAANFVFKHKGFLCPCAFLVGSAGAYPDW